jgi:hypothetical protein
VSSLGCKLIGVILMTGCASLLMCIEHSLPCRVREREMRDQVRGLFLLLN